MGDLDEFIRECERAWQDFVIGDPAPAKRLFSHRDDVTLANPWGPAVRGWQAVSRTLEAAANRIRDGHVTDFDVIASFVSDYLACFHETERRHARFGARADPSPFELRATSVYRREEGAWKLVLRHADPIVTPRSADATLDAQAGTA